MVKIIGNFVENKNGAEYETLEDLINEQHLIGDLIADLGSASGSVALLYPSEENRDCSVRVVAVNSENYYGENKSSEINSKENDALKIVLDNCIDLLMETNNYKSKRDLYKEIGMIKDDQEKLSCASNEFYLKVNPGETDIHSSFAAEDVASYLDTKADIHIFNLTKNDIFKIDFMIDFNKHISRYEYVESINIIRIKSDDMTEEEFDKIIELFHSNNWSYTNRTIGAYENSFTMILNNKFTTRHLPRFILDHNLNMDLLRVERRHHLPEGHISLRM